ncbi:UNKNOWN [Stylonychia lemnae]|uniref:Uncharacterized protein n=1 Tax=Stylonychia lemnae TaxID=5949 RepID=A0A078AHF9_STYLE|nr:UNKNOWN [Stylonychia lemnae]|eukprot:CDW81281.1 UNKNOWN [Stylonychia lemnae]
MHWYKNTPQTLNTPQNQESIKLMQQTLEVPKDTQSVLITKTFSFMAIFHMLMSLGLIFHQLLVRKLIENESDVNMSVSQYVFGIDNQQLLHLILLIPGNLMCGMYLFNVSKSYIASLSSPLDSSLIENSSKSERKSLKSAQKRAARANVFSYVQDLSEFLAQDPEIGQYQI